MKINKINTGKKEPKLEKDIKKALKGVKLLLEYFPTVVVKDGESAIIIENNKGAFFCEIHPINIPQKKIKCISKVFNEETQNIDPKTKEEIRKLFIKFFGEANKQQTGK